MGNGEPVQFVQDLSEVVVLPSLRSEASCTDETHLRSVYLSFGKAKKNTNIIIESG